MTPKAAGTGVLGALAAVAAHVLVIATGFLAVRFGLVETADEGFADIAAALGLVLLGELLLFIAVIVSTVLLTIKGRRPLAVGIVTGWLLTWIVMIVLARS